MSDIQNQLEQLSARAATLYSRPTVALELVRLAEEPQADAQTLTNCVSQDPALVCKVLRVVNSSLFGLHRPVADLNQAIGLLGIKPLKLLVLGFTLPDTLFAEVAARELEWYWTNTLTRAVAARMLAEQLYAQPGDEAFIAGLLQDIGILVLLRELGEPYARFLTGVIDENCHLASLENDTLGFDHVQLSATMLGRWQLPPRLVEAIAAPKRVSRLSRLNPPEGDLPQILHLAELLMQIVGQSQLELLPELLEAGKVYRGMTKSKLTALVEGLQLQVDQLADALSLGLTLERDYMQMLVEAQRKMATLSEEIASDNSEEDDAIYTQLLEHTGELTSAMQSFLSGKKLRAQIDGERTQAHAAHYGKHKTRGFVGKSPAETEPQPERVTLLRKLAAGAKSCRERRRELSLLLVESAIDDPAPEQKMQTRPSVAQRVLESACESLPQSSVALLPFGKQGAAAVISNCERSAALALARVAISEVAKHATLATTADDEDAAPVLSVGVATMSVVPKNFDGAAMLESAARCLSAAKACDTSAVKSIEV